MKQSVVLVAGLEGGGRLEVRLEHGGGQTVLSFVISDAPPSDVEVIDFEPESLEFGTSSLPARRAA